MSASAAVAAPKARRKPEIVRDAARELEAVRVLRAQLADITDDEDTIRDTLEGETDLDGLVRDLLASIGEDEAKVEGLSDYAKTLAERRDRFSTRAGIKRALLLSALEISGRPSIETDVGTVSLKTVPPKLEVSEEADIPSEFWLPQPPKLDRTALNDALKEGRAVPGAVRGNGGITIAIKRG